MVRLQTFLMSKKLAMNLDQSLLRTKKDRRRAKSVLDELARSAVANGLIEPNLDIESRRREFIDLWPKIRKSMYLTVDHTSTILRYANEFRCAGRNEIAVLLYATACEQKINLFISTFATRAGFHADRIPQLIRDTNFNARCTWLLELLKAPLISPVHLKRMKQLMDIRNEFVHYKWKGEWIYELPKQKVHLDFLQSFSKTLRYLAIYERKNIYFGSVKQNRTKRAAS